MTEADKIARELAISKKVEEATTKSDSTNESRDADLISAKWKLCGAIEDVIDEGEEHELRKLEDLSAQLAFVKVIAKIVTPCLSMRRLSGISWASSMLFTAFS